MQTVTTIGLDTAKSVFQVHGVNAAGQLVIRRQLKRRYVLAFFQKLPPCLIGIEACASSHHWSRELQVLGHTGRLMPPAYVKPYVTAGTNARSNPTRSVLLRVCLWVSYTDFCNIVDGRFGLSMERLDGYATECSAGQHRQSDFQLHVHTHH
jgi:hypothetical protein